SVLLMTLSQPTSTLFPYTTLFRSKRNLDEFGNAFYTKQLALGEPHLKPIFFEIEVLDRYFNDPRFDFEFKDYSGQISCLYDKNEDRKSTRLNSSHVKISYAVFCLK